MEPCATEKGLEEKPKYKEEGRERKEKVMKSDLRD